MGCRRKRCSAWMQRGLSCSCQLIEQAQVCLSNGAQALLN